MQLTFRNLFICLGLISLCFVAIPIRVKNVDQIELDFQKFIVLHKKPYNINSTEYEERLQNFRASHERSLRHNQLHGSYSRMNFGITKFSDLRPEEFQELLLRHQPSAEQCVYRSSLKKQQKQMTYTAIRRREVLLSNEDLPDYIDWRERQAVTSVKNQLSCGACWAFSTVATVESMYAIKTKNLKEISVQQVIDCAKNGNLGCVGGDTCSALKWMTTTNVSLVDEKEYPLTLKNQYCRKINSPGIRVATNFTCYNLLDDEETFMRLLAFHGPVTAAVDAITWQDYLGGVIQYHCLDRINHAVQVVGYDRRGQVPYYIVKNSWGTDFGIDGYVHVAIGKNLCGIAREVSAIDVVV